MPAGFCCPGHSGLRPCAGAHKDEIEILFPRRDSGCSVKTNVMDEFLSDGTIDFFKDIGIEKCEDYDE